jgi:nucleotide-binding universal stress UspA family protein
MFHRILAAVDSSRSAQAIIKCVSQLYPLGVRECVLTQCFMVREQVAFPEEVREYIQSQLQLQKKMIEDAGIHTKTIVRLGIAGRDIPLIAEEQDCSLIVVGSHGHNLASEILLGGTASEIMHQSTRPVMIIHLKENSEAIPCVCPVNEYNLIGHILYATDFSEHSSRAFEYVKKFVGCGSDHITMIHVQDKVKLHRHKETELEEFNRIDRGRLELLKKKLEVESNAQIDIDISYGSPADEIIKKSVSTNAGLIIMGSHGRGFISEIFVGSVSYNVARHSSSAVLLIPKS